MLAAGCEKQYSWDFQSEDLNVLIVDGIITNEYRQQFISLSLSNPIINSETRPLSGAMVSVSDQDTEMSFYESKTEPGKYYSETPFQVVVNRSYLLQVEYGDELFEALADVVPVTSLGSISVVPDTGRYYRYIFTGEGQPAMTRVDYNWSADPDYCMEYGNCFAREFFYLLENTDINAVFAPDKATILFPSETVIVRKKYSLTEEHQAFLRSLLMETDWSGGVFDVQHDNVVTNLSNGARGYFAACMVASDTTVVE
jgi:hypothetical protein